MNIGGYLSKLCKRQSCPNCKNEIITTETSEEGKIKIFNK